MLIYLKFNCLGKREIMKRANNKIILSGVSTLDAVKKYRKFGLLLLIMTVFSGIVFGGHSTLDLVDPSFNPQIQTNQYSLKWVNGIQALPDGKILALGGFNTYNGVPVGKFVRLNADGSLDTTFNNQTVTAINSPGSGRIFVQPDGKIIINAVGLIAGGQGPKPLFRLNADGTLDTSFNFTQTGFVGAIVMDSLGRITITGDNYTTPNGTRRVIRLNADGSVDTSFNYIIPAGASLQNIAIQGNRLIVITDVSNNRRLYRLNEDGSEDTSFMPVTGLQLYLGRVQPDNKILYQQDLNLMRLNEDGSPDTTFQTIDSPQVSNSDLLKFTGDGKLVFMTSSSPATFRRYLSNGAVDPSFTPFTTTTFASYTIQNNDNIVMGDGVPFNASSANNFVRLTSGGAVDPTFNAGGSGFQNIQPGIIQAVETYPDGRILLGGKFDFINGVTRLRLARLNADSTVDNTFQISTTSSSGNYFSVFRDVYQIKVQPDGKIIVAGWFDYVLNGETKINLVRLNPNGSIDPTFNLNYRLTDYSQINSGGQNRFNIYGDGRLMVGASRQGSTEINGPIRFLTNGTRDTTFNSTLLNTVATLYIHDVALQPDGKVLVSGESIPNSPNPVKSFVARLNSDGSIDSTFLYSEVTAYLKSRLALLPDGKVLIIESAIFTGGSARIRRLNSNGSLDSSFNALSFSDGAAKLNALLVLPNGKIFVGGKFTQTIGGQTGRNLIQLEADGTFAATVYNLNEEVLALAADAEGRVLVGGGFTVIGSNGESTFRSFAARLTDSQARFDFDGDGRSDYGTFRQADGVWGIILSQTNQYTAVTFGMSGDKTAAADYDGDGKADAAVYRPSDGTWHLLRSRDGYFTMRWGIAEDKPVAGDYDGDGKNDIVVWRPSSGVWYIMQSSNFQAGIIRFGLTGDIPLPETDFDGDGKTDIAVWRPSDGNFYWLESGNSKQYRVVHFGMNGDIPAAADYNGDGKTDLVVYRPAEGNWYQYLTKPDGGYTFAVVRFGLEGDEPIAADYDGDGKTDIAVRRGNIWHVLGSYQGYSSFVFGAEDDTAIASFPVQ